jgi:hypothetical protein
VTPAIANAAAAADVTADKIPVSSALTLAVPTETFPADKAANEPTPSNKVPVVAAPITPPPGK